MSSRICYHFTTYDAAWQNAANLNWRIGTLIAEITIPDGIDFEHDGPDERGHCTLYDLSATDVLGRMTRVTWAPSSRPPSRN